MSNVERMKQVERIEYLMEIFSEVMRHHEGSDDFEITSQILAWSDRVSGAGEMSDETADLYGNAVVDAVRQVCDRRAGRAGLRLLAGNGMRALFTWDADKAPPPGSDLRTVAHNMVDAAMDGRQPTFSQVELNAEAAT